MSHEAKHFTVTLHSMNLEVLLKFLSKRFFIIFCKIKGGLIFVRQAVILTTQPLSFS